LTILLPVTGDADVTILPDEVMLLLLNALTSPVLLANNNSAC
jgi:hypothetical protein